MFRRVAPRDIGVEFDDARDDRGPAARDNARSLSALGPSLEYEHVDADHGPALGYRDEPVEVQFWDLTRELFDYLTNGESCGYVCQTGPYSYDAGRPIGYRGTKSERKNWHVYHQVRAVKVPPLPKWRPVRQRTADGRTKDRVLTVSTSHSHIHGKGTIAYRSPAWCGCGCIDIDKHGEGGEQDRDDRLRMVVRILRSMGCEPVVLRSPGHGYHVWFRLDTPVPRDQLRRLIRQALIFGGYSMRETDIFPQAKAIRWPCGPKQFVINPDTLEPVPGAAHGSRRDNLGNLRAFVSRLRVSELRVSDLEHFVGKTEQPGRMASEQPGRMASKSKARTTKQPTDGSQEFSGRGRVRRGLEFIQYVEQLLERGCWRTGQRWDAVQTLAFYWVVTRGLSRPRARLNLCNWFRSHEHVSNSSDFVGECLTNFDSYAEHLQRGLDAGTLTRGSTYRDDSACVHIKASCLVKIVWEVPWEGCLSQWLAWLSPRHGQTVSIPKHRGQSGNGALQIGGRATYTVPGEFTSSGAKKRSRVSWAVMDKLIDKGVLTRVGNHSAGSHGRQYRIDLGVIAALQEQLQMETEPDVSVGSMDLQNQREPCSSDVAAVSADQPGTKIESNGVGTDAIAADPKADAIAAKMSGADAIAAKMCDEVTFVSDVEVVSGELRAVAGADELLDHAGDGVETKTEIEGANCNNSGSGHQSPTAIGCDDVTLTDPVEHLRVSRSVTFDHADEPGRVAVELRDAVAVDDQAVELLLVDGDSTMTRKSGVSGTTDDPGSIGHDRELRTRIGESWGRGALRAFDAEKLTTTGKQSPEQRAGEHDNVAVLLSGHGSGCTCFEV